MEGGAISHTILFSTLASGETIFSIFVLALFLWIVRPWSGANSKGTPRSSVERMILYMLTLIAIIFIVRRVFS